MARQNKNKSLYQFLNDYLSSAVNDINKIY